MTYLIVGAVGVAILVLVISKWQESKNAAPDRPERVSMATAKDRCQTYIPKACRSIARCTPGFYWNTGAVDASGRGAAVQPLLDDAIASCTKELGASECDNPDYQWQTASDFDLDWCFRDPYCDCDGISPCQGKLNWSDNCPRFSVPMEHYVDLDAASLELALMWASSYGGGETDRDAPRTVEFLRWASKHLTWTTVSAPKQPTKAGRVFKDPTAEYGKGMCASGRLIQINKRWNGGFESILSLDDYSTVRLLSVQSTGDLLEGNRARFCGIVMGVYSYTNRSNGTMSAIDVVGIFDLPENRGGTDTRTGAGKE